MAVVFTPATTHPGRIQSLGSLLGLIGTLTFSGSYATGGDPLDLSQFFKVISSGSVIIIPTTARGTELEYDPVAKKIKMWSSANTELAAGAYNAALTATPVPFLAIGR